MESEWDARDSKLRQKASSKTELSSETLDKSRNILTEAVETSLAWVRRNTRSN